MPLNKETKLNVEDEIVRNMKIMSAGTKFIAINISK